MRLIASTAVSLFLLTAGCARTNQEGATPGSGASPSATTDDPPAATGSRTGGTAATGAADPVVRVAELEIDPAQLKGYTAAVREEMETSVRVEPGVLAIYCVAEKDNPAKLRFFEMYADEAAYRAHIDSPHFKKYVETTKGMITSRRLIDAVPVQLSAKRR
jgi:quinol monooxygenase YgiN